MIKHTLSIKPTWLYIIVLLTIISGLFIAYNVVNAQKYYPVGNNAMELGVTDYKVEQTKEATTVYFGHIEQGKSGKLVIRTNASNNSISLNLSQDNGQTISIMWIPDPGDFTLQDSASKSANFVYKEPQWVADSVVAQNLLDEYAEEVKLTGAIYSDFDIDESQQDLQDTTQSLATPCIKDENNPSMYCPCYGYKVRGECVKTTRSEACYCATGDASYHCWNEWCIGCCAWVGPDCDCACLIGDYFCACGRGGWSCSGPCQ